MRVIAKLLISAALRAGGLWRFHRGERDASQGVLGKMEPPSMFDWNVIVGVKPGEFPAAEAAMARFGPMQRSAIVDILTVKVADAEALGLELDLTTRGRST